MKSSDHRIPAGGGRYEFFCRKSLEASIVALNVTRRNSLLNAPKSWGQVTVPEQKIEQALAMKASGMKETEIAKQLSLGRSTVYRVLKG